MFVRFADAASGDVWRERLCLRVTPLLLFYYASYARYDYADGCRYVHYYLTFIVALDAFIFIIITPLDAPC